MTMTLTLKTKTTLNKLLFLGVIVLGPFLSSAQGLELSVTPTLFEMSAVPGQLWNSQIKVINSNSYPITVYADVKNFAPQGEGGHGKFLPVFDEFTEGTTLAEWIDINGGAVTIPPEQSQTIPFTVNVPDDASPGGHFAAILIGTRPPAEDGLTVSTSQIVTSLFFARVAGDVVEEGVIREFNTDRKFVQSPHAEFVVRFENKGNVHIQPQGQIEIYNMWGKERGVIPINSRTHFGNVLPASIRKFEFAWKGEQSITDIGRYKATLTLGYGLDGRKFQTSITYFYVVPVKAMLIVLGSLLFGVLFISWAIRAYVRHMLALSGVDMRQSRRIQQQSFKREGDVLIERQRPRIEAPLTSGWSDFIDRLQGVTALTGYIKVLGRFIIQYKLFFGSLVIFGLLFVLLLNFVHSVGDESKKYEITIDNADQDVTLSSEDIIYEARQASVETSPDITDEMIVSTSSASSSPTIELINAGDISGAAAELRLRLEAVDMDVTSISSDFSDSRERTAVIYAPGLEEEALAISKLAHNALLSADPAASGTITVFIGNDFDFSE